MIIPFIFDQHNPTKKHLKLLILNVLETVFYSSDFGLMGFYQF